jgi:pimeloyl-ACP methyl ester carboxylesterase
MKLVELIPVAFQIVSLINPRLAGRLSVELLFRPQRSKRSAEENKFWAKGLPLTFASGCTGRVFGHGEKSIVLVHGWQSQGVRFLPLIEACMKLGLKVVVWNGPGHGDSPGKRTNLAAFSRLLFKDLQALDHQYEAILGYSFGAAAAAYVCRLGLPAKLLILISGPSSASGVFRRYWDMIKLGPKARNHFVSMVETEVQLKVDDMSSVLYATELPQRILAIHDQNDKIVPVSDAFELQKARPDIELLVTEKLGHHRILNAEVMTQKVSNFLCNHLLRADATDLGADDQNPQHSAI